MAEYQRIGDFGGRVRRICGTFRYPASSAAIIICLSSWRDFT
jgi:hypothetical protein